MQEMNEWLNDRWSDPSKLISCIEVYDKIQELLPKEKQQIVDAAETQTEKSEITGLDYYNQTYKP